MSTPGAVCGGLSPSGSPGRSEYRASGGQDSPRAKVSQKSDQIRTLERRPSIATRPVPGEDFAPSRTLIGSMLKVAIMALTREPDEAHDADEAAEEHEDRERYAEEEVRDRSCRRYPPVLDPCCVPVDVGRPGAAKTIHKRRHHHARASGYLSEFSLDRSASRRTCARP